LYHIHTMCTSHKQHTSAVRAKEKKYIVTLTPNGQGESYG